MSRHSKPETADRVTINKQSIVAPNQPLVSNEAKNNMKDNYQNEKQKVDNSKPVDGNLNTITTSDFENDTNHTEYQLEVNAANISLSGDTTGVTNARTSEEEVQVITYNSNIYDNTNFTDDQTMLVGDTKVSDKYGDYAVLGASSNKSNIFQESKFVVPIGLSLNIVPYSFNFYQRVKTDVRQIILHHTVSDPSEGKQIINTWNGRNDGVATHFVVKNDGIVFQTFDLSYWAYHIGCHDNRNLRLNQNSVGIEISNWGGLTKKNGKIYTAYNNEISDNGDLIFFQDGFRGYYYFQRYTQQQIASIRQLILYIAKQYNIPLTYNNDMWDYSESAMNGKPGIWTHVSYRKDKSDCFPQDNLIGMLKGLNI